ncbi:MAG: triose-phosphate isomerase [Cycloclasticus sp.]|nr:MAG: triose-phosphate isomerase [Cycloclasticus sp.]
MRQPLVVGNWKMNGSLQFISNLLHSIQSNIDDKISCEIGVCVPFVYVGLAIDVAGKSSIKVGAQTVSEHTSGAYTGEVSASMLEELGCHWVLVGHSERRQLFNEVNEQLVTKVMAAQRAGLIPIYCVGETEAERKSGDTFSVIEKQINALIDNESINLTNLVLAYEPVWAIGTGLTATPDEAQEAHAFIRQLVKNKAGDLADKLRILYGGSVKADNAETLFHQEDIDGGLIGGASLDANAFISICQMA